MQIYRVEIPYLSEESDEKRWIGPYQYLYMSCDELPVDLHNACERMYDSHSGFGQHPHRPHLHFRDNYSYTHFAGCSSMPELVAWFGGHYSALMRHGARVRRYDVDSAIEDAVGYRQWVFKAADIVRASSKMEGFLVDKKGREVYGKFGQRV